MTSFELRVDQHVRYYTEVEADTLAEAIELVNEGEWDDRSSTVLSDNIQPAGRNDSPSKVMVVFVWSTEHGECHDCGRPAGFQVIPAKSNTGRTGPAPVLCGVCAANWVVDGDAAGLTRLFEED